MDSISKIAAFKRLHQSGCFVIPNPWDVGTAIYLQRLGFKALATTSAGYSFSRGLPDAVSAIPRDEMLAHIRELVAATTLPINADFQNGYADSPEEVAENVKLCASTGVAGLSIEDASGDENLPLYKTDHAIERIHAARTALDELGSEIVLTARCEAWLVGDPTPFQTALRRLVAFADAGADCLFAPGVRDPKEIEAIVKAVAPKPVNVIVSGSDTGLSVSRLADLGVRRISVGSALARTAWGAFSRASKHILNEGSFEGFADSATFKELNEVFGDRL